MTANNSPFQKPSKPKNGLEVLHWAFFEPVLFVRFSDTLTRKNSLRWFARAYLWISLFSVFLWFTGMSLIIIFDMPAMFPEIYKTEFLDIWQQFSNLFAKVFILAVLTWKFLIIGLGLGLVSGSVIGIMRGNSNVIASLYAGLLFGISISLNSWGGGTVNIAQTFIVFLSFGFFMGFVFSSFSFNPQYSFVMAISLVFGFVITLLYGIRSGFGGGLGFISAFYIGYFRLLFYPIHILMGFAPLTFTRNPYCRDGVIRLPLWFVNRKLFKLAKKDPYMAMKFVFFLLEYRLLQQKLAARLTHVANAGFWIQGAYDLGAKAFFYFSIPEDQPEFLPSEQWLTMVAQVQEQLRASQQHTQIGLKTAAFEEFLKLLRAFREQTLRESRKWNQDYLEALDLWLKIAHEHLRSLRQQAALLEPMATNIYRSGEALHPNLDADIFVGRDDLRETLAREILTARAMPMFLIQGQRRVGKTSLLNFLPVLLGPQFQVVFQDMQSERTASVHRWLTDLRQRVNKQFRFKEDAWNPPQDWLEAWGQMREHLEQICTQQKCKIILAFDEYENFQRNFQDDPLQAQKLLGAMRSFSQHQTQVVFLFTGAKFFSELQTPNWNEYFVQIKHLRVDYLKQTDALKLIQHPIPEFNLVYPDDVAQRIFNLTQGHPALVQHTCSELVNLANRSHRKHITHDDVETVLHHGDNCLLSPENPAIRVFWSQFCSKDSPDTAVHRTTLRQILAGQTPTDKASLFRLEQHGYIVQDGDTWKMRVPLFDMWLRKYADILA